MDSPRRFFALAGALMLMLMVSSPVSAANPQLVMQTSHGAINIELFADKAPVSVKNFLNYIERGFYDKTIFHRVIPDFMIQGGGFTTDMIRKPTRDPITNEADNGAKNLRGTLAMARTQQPDSATAQFFINLKDNDFLDHSGKSLRGWGYAVFGKVTAGMDVVDAIAAEPTRRVGGMSDVPVNPVIIETISVTDSE